MNDSFYNDGYVEILNGNSLYQMEKLTANSVHCVITSPPYWGLRKYDGDQEFIWGGDNNCNHEWVTENIVKEIRTGLGLAEYSKNYHRGGGIKIGSIPKSEYQIGHCIKCNAWLGGFGLEPTPQMYVEHTIEILRSIKRVLRDDGVVFWNIGDSYAGSSKGYGSDHGKAVYEDENISKTYWGNTGLKPKDLCLIPQRVAIAAQDDGWWVRSIIIWSKPNPMPESVQDRPTVSHEYILMLTKSRQYYWDQVAVRENNSDGSKQRFGLLDGIGQTKKWNSTDNKRDGRADGTKSTENFRDYVPLGRNMRTVWDFATQPYPEAHFAVFPPELPKRCILAATSEKGNCANCGKPWVRLTDKAFSDHKGKTNTNYDDNSTAGRLAKLRQSARENGNEYTSEVKTIGWQPQCTCNGHFETHQLDDNSNGNKGIIYYEKYIPDIPLDMHPINPSLVIDPFGGSGTVASVAKSIGRRAIIIEISEAYCELAKKRVEKIPYPLF